MNRYAKEIKMNSKYEQITFGNIDHFFHSILNLDILSVILSWPISPQASVILGPLFLPVTMNRKR
jgi:hypothetical protein